MLYRRKLTLASGFIGMSLVCLAATSVLGQRPTKFRDLSVEVVPVLELPISVERVVLSQTDNGYVLKGSLSNGSELRMFGLRYSLIAIDPLTGAHLLANRSEGFSLLPYETKPFAFGDAIKLKQKNGTRLVLMLEQAIARESIWEVIRAKDTLEGYARGDYSLIPRVMRVANQVDAPLPSVVIY